MLPQINYKHHLLVMLAYFGLGLAGLLLAIPPGYASPIFPAAGFAAAIMLWSGRRAWPGIMLGSFLLNLSAGGLGESGYAASALIALEISLGSTLQAYVAAYLVERLTGLSWRSMESAGDIVRMLTVAGPLSCLISASGGTGALYANGVAPPSDILFTWWNWWAGDTLGVLVVLPLTLAMLFRARSPWSERQIALGLPMLVTLIVIAVGYVAVAKWERQGRALEVRRYGEQLARVLEQRFIAHAEALAALQRLIVVTPDMSYAQFDHFTRITLLDNPDIFALSYNPYVRKEDRAKIERQMAVATQKTDFEITERDPRLGLVRAKSRPDYVAVGYISPLEGNIPAIGYDINSEPVRREAIRLARESHRPSITAPIQLVQESRKRVGALLLHPAYETVSVGSALSEGRLIGFAVAVIKLDHMVQIATESVRIPGLAFRIEDIAAGENGKVFQSDEASPPAKQAATARISLKMANRVWELSVYPTAAYYQANRPWIAWATCVAGLLLAALLQVLLLVTTGHASVAERKVRRQSAELETQGAELQDRTALINTLFDLSPDGFVAFAPDGTVRFANPAFYNMTGIPADEIVGLSIGSLDNNLRQRSERPDQYVSLESLFSGGRDITGQRLLLARPREVALQIVCVRSNAASIDRFAYFRNVTIEAEVDRMKSEFLSHAAHELRTPMASIYGFSELLMTREFDETTRKDLVATIHRQTAWLVEIINELLDLVRIEERRGQDFRMQEIRVASLIDEVIEAMQIDPVRWPLETDCAEDLPQVRGDEAKLRQALTNVLANAVKYSPAGGRVGIRCILKMVDGLPYIGISMTDHGIGMTPEQAARVGERFFRADTSGNIPGSGLGMAIVKEIVGLHGGRIEIASSLGGGTTVTVWLPATIKS